MNATEEVFKQVLRKIVPGLEEKEKVLSLAQKLKKRVINEAETLKLDVKVEIGGSVAKDTWLSGDADLDIFVLFPKDFSKEKLEKKGLEIAINAVKEWKPIKRFAEHPYIEAKVEGTRVNVVPCYKVERGKWLSAADRSPFHTEYIKQRLEQDDLRNEIRLLKRFMKGIGTYGAEIKVGGFSGYLCEIMVLAYGSFFDTLITTADWQPGQVVDLQGFYSQLREIEILFDSPLIAIDPIDQYRNAAASVSEEKMSEFAFASKMFLKDPKQTFFFPPKIKPYSDSELEDVFQKRGTDTLFLSFDGVDTVPDILWGQLYKSMRSIQRLLKQYDFQVVKTSAWSDEKNLNILIIEVESSNISDSKRHLGPQANLKDAEKFLKKHLNAKETVSGPWIEEGRWIVTVKRQHSNAVSMLREKLMEGGRNVGVGSKLVESVKRSLKIYLNNEISEMYSERKDFVRFLTIYLIGKPTWLLKL